MAKKPAKTATRKPATKSAAGKPAATGVKPSRSRLDRVGSLDVGGEPVVVVPVALCAEWDPARITGTQLVRCFGPAVAGLPAHLRPDREPDGTACWHQFVHCRDLAAAIARCQELAAAALEAYPDHALRTNGVVVEDDPARWIAAQAQAGFHFQIAPGPRGTDAVISIEVYDTDDSVDTLRDREARILEVRDTKLVGFAPASASIDLHASPARDLLVIATRDADLTAKSKSAGKISLAGGVRITLARTANATGIDVELPKGKYALAYHPGPGPAWCTLTRA